MIEFLQTQLVPIGLSNAIFAGALAIIAAELTCRSRWPGWTHALWVLVLIKLVAPPVVWFTTAVFVAPAAETNVAQSLVRESDTGGTTEVALPDDFPNTTSVAGAAAPSESDAVSIAGVPFPWLYAIGVFWLFGSAISLLRLSWQGVTFYRWMHRSSARSQSIHSRMLQVAERLGLRSVPTVRVAPGVFAPSVFGLAGHWTIILPRDLAAQLNDGELETVIAHELAHLKRRDHWVRLLEVVARVLFWWYPLVRIVQNRIERSADEACDQMVKLCFPDHMRSYASAMLKTVEFLSSSHSKARRNQMAFPMLTGMGDVRSLARRMREISVPARSSRFRWLRHLSLAVAAVFVLPLGIGMLPQESVAQQPDRPQSSSDSKKSNRDPRSADPFRTDPFSAQDPFGNPKPERNAGTADKPARSSSRTDAQDPFAPRRKVGTPDKREQPQTKRIANSQAVSDRLRSGLQREVSLEVIDVPLVNAIQSLQDQVQLPMMLDTRSLDELGLTPDLPITISLDNVSLRSCLRLILDKFDLTYMIKDEVIQITTREHAEQNLALRAYALPSELAERSEKAIEALVATVQPDTWEQLGGPSSVKAIDHVLVVSTTEAVHEQVDRFIQRVEAAFEARKKKEAAAISK